MRVENTSYITKRYEAKFSFEEFIKWLELTIPEKPDRVEIHLTGVDGSDQGGMLMLRNGMVKATVEWKEHK